jgi:hypothetical protein
MFSFPVAAVAGVYRWVDENGQVHFGNIPPKQQKEYRSGYEDYSTNNKTVNKKGGKIENMKGKKSPGSKNETQNDKSLNANAKKDKNSNNISAGKIKETRAKRIKDKKANIKSKKATKKRVSENTNNKEVINSADPAKSAGIKENTKLDDLLKSLHGKNNRPAKNSENDKLDTKLTSKPNKSTVKTINTDKNIGLKGSGPKNQPASKKQSKKIPGKKESGNKVKHGDTAVKVKIESKIKPSSNNKKSQEEKCGFFRGYVDTYQYRMKYECPGEHCDLLKRELDKYKKKAARYCND